MHYLSKQLLSAILGVGLTVPLQAAPQLDSLHVESSSYKRLIELAEVSVSAPLSKDHKTPVSATLINTKEIRESYYNREFPDLLRCAVGVYTTRQGGAYGDSRMSIRGFSQENVAVMINGVPMNDMEHGGVYWSNWMSLSENTRYAEIQRGLGTSRVSSPSIGGSVNIVTHSTSPKMGGRLTYALGNDGYNHTAFNFSSGEMRGWSLTLAGSRSWGLGYIQGTDFVGYSWFASLTKRIGGDHILSLIAYGAPQEHGQRNNNDRLTIEEWAKVGSRYNPSYGFGVAGQQKYGSYNSYHKPQISLSYKWQIDEHSSLDALLYTSIGRGYGHSGQGGFDKSLGINTRYAWFGSTNGLINSMFRAADGTFDYGAIYALNDTCATGARMSMSRSYNNHNWYGLMSAYTREFNQWFKLHAGLDVRYYEGQHYNQLSDLYGSEYVLDGSRNSVTYRKQDKDWVNQPLYVGDVIFRDYSNFIMQSGLFANLEFQKGGWSAYIQGVASLHNYWRYDRFYYAPEEARSETTNFLGWHTKAGLSYSFAKGHTLFGHIGYQSRAPFISSVFLSNDVSNRVNREAVNEKAFTAEIGYVFDCQYASAKLGLYRIAWMDKSIPKLLDLPDNEKGYLNLTGVNAIHQGIEVEVIGRPVKGLELYGSFAWGWWNWKGVTSGYGYNSQGQPLAVDAQGKLTGATTEFGADNHAKATLNLNNTPVSNAPQSSFGLGAKYQIAGFFVGLDYQYYMRQFANYKLTATELQLSKETIISTPWQMPDFGLMNMQAGYQFSWSKMHFTLSGQIDNLIGDNYIADATDGATHDSATAQVFYGLGRTWSLHLTVGF